MQLLSQKQKNLSLIMTSKLMAVYLLAFRCLPYCFDKFSICTDNKGKKKNDISCNY